jgi:hypothetical protein
VKISYVGPSFTLNNERTMHHHARAALVREWRDPVTMIVRQPQYRWRAPGPVGIEVWAWCRADADRGAYFPAAKAMIDGLNDDPKTGHVGWWPDDDGTWVHWEKHYVPVRDMRLPKGMVRVEIGVVIL